MNPSKVQIYIVDDDESVCRALKRLLTAYNYAVRTFSSAEEFFSAIPNSASGCLILDVHLPGLKGWEVQERLLKSGSQRPIIVITGDGDPELKELVLEAGAVGFLQKPLNSYALIDAVNGVLNNEIGMVNTNEAVYV